VVRVAVSTLTPRDENRWSYHVKVTESNGSGSQTRHKVSMDKEYYEKAQNEIKREWQKKPGFNLLLQMKM
jgi:hypothetical protein